MITWRTATVVSSTHTWPGASEHTIELHPHLPGHPTVKALAYTDLVGTPKPGDTLLVNVSALARGLGTGGYALVIANTTTTPQDPPPGPGHLVKARYTPHQTLVLGIDEQESPHHSALADADCLHHTPVILADLHSALPAICAGARHAAALAGRPMPRITYVMTDGGALPAAFSRTIAALRETEWLDACITVGQSFGGDHEAVTLHTGLLAAHHVLDADLVVVTQGPGNLGTGTRWGFSGVGVGDAVNAVNVLGGHPIASLRVSGADLRERHRGISHHSLTAYGRVALTPADIPIASPTTAIEALAGWGPDLTRLVDQQAVDLLLPAGRHTRIDVAGDEALLDALHSCPVRLSTMGRGLDTDPAAFLTAAVAGVHAHSRIAVP